jgi:preprotein translocase subunit YajC
VPGFLIIAGTALVWVFVIRAVKQRQVGAHHAFIAGLRPGDRVTTAGGIFGTIRAIDADRCQLEIAPGVVIDLVPIVINRRVEAAGSDPTAQPDDDDAAPAPTPDGADVRLDKD